MRQTAWIAAGLTFVLGVVFSCTTQTAPPVPPPPVPTPTPDRASENPEDIRARIPNRPTPPQPESKFPPPQQPPEEEEREANKPNEPELLHVQPAIRLDGAPFPEKITYEPSLVEAKRLRYVAADAAPGGDGSAQHPWNDLQAALCQLVPGERLLLTPAVYEGSFRVGPSCHGGTADAPIQVFARHAFLKPRGDGDVLTVEQPFWQFWEVQIALGHSEVAGFVTRGPGAHDIAVDQSHVYEGRGPAVRIAAGSARIKISNSHIHMSGGIEIEAGSRDITILTSHIHHNFGTSVTIGSGDATAVPAENIQVIGSRFQNDHGSGLRILRARGVRVLHDVYANYRPDEEEGTGGTAIVVGGGSSDVRFEDDSILEASLGVRIGEKGSSGPPPEKVVIQRSFFQNTLTQQSLALDVVAGSEIRFNNNVVDRYSDGVHTTERVQGLSVVNNLFLAAKTAMVIPALNGAFFFDYNVFGPEPALGAVIGGRSQRLSALTSKAMPHTQIKPSVEISGGDLGKLTGFSPVDQGKAMPGLTYKGAAPDIGVAEK